MMRIGLMVMGKVEMEEPGRKLSLGGVIGWREFHDYVRARDLDKSL